MPILSNSSNIFNETYRKENLHAQCENCFGLCCVALPFAEGADFAMDKEGGIPCTNLQDDFRCGIHRDLRKNGFRGCTVYECFGAGQKVSQMTYKGKDWRKSPETKQQMFEILPIMQQLHEMLWFLYEALTIEITHAIHPELRRVYDKVDKLTLLSPENLQRLDVQILRSEINQLLLETSELVRSETVLKKKDTIKIKIKKKVNRGADLIGANLKRADLRGTNLRGALLIAADLKEADVRNSDCIGADFRDANLSGADFRGCIFLTQDQLNSAKGDKHTKLPPLLTHPAHWISS